MAFAEDLMFAGLGVMVVAVVLFVFGALKAARKRAEHHRNLPEEYPGQMLDAYMLLIWSGLLLSQISNILFHEEPGGIYRVIPLMWIGTGADVAIVGVYIGRLMMRWEMRLYKRKRDEQMREALA